MAEPIVGMYIHQHWAYRHPYCARTWTFEDWEGYLEALHRLGFNTVLIWPVLETMPDPLTESDVANLTKIARVIDAAHERLGMRVHIVLCPNVAADNEAAAKRGFEERSFFYSDYRVDPGDAVAVKAMIQWRERLLAPLAAMDALVIIDSDPGGYPGSTAEEFVNLLGAHRRALDRLRPGIELINWVHAGWEAYCEFYSTGDFRMGTQAELERQVRLLARLDPEPWGVAISGRPTLLDEAGFSERVIHYAYGAIEGEPSFPRTTFRRDAAYEAGRRHADRGVMGNAQTHCVQLPNTFAFIRGAQGLPLADEDLLRFARDLLPGCCGDIMQSWLALDTPSPDRADALATQLEALRDDELQTGPLRGLLFGSPRRFVDDLKAQLRLRAALYRALAAVPSAGHSRDEFRAASATVLDLWRTWQQMHGYRCRVGWPELLRVLSELRSPTIDTMLARAAQFRGDGDTPYRRLHDHLRQAESETTRLIRETSKALGRG